MTPPSDARATATGRTVQALRDMITRSQLFSGEQIRQDAVSERLGVSRSPLREALRILESEGLLRHVPNQGYFVARLSRSELRQIYLMRTLLETELLKTIRRPSPSERGEIRRLGRSIEEHARDANVAAIVAANRAFHLTIFALSDLDLVRGQVERLWNLSDPYRSTYLSLPENVRRIQVEHAAMIDAIERFDLTELVRLADEHRRGTETALTALLPFDG
jgi:DNA-binding GntR family transcriptional regulator